MRRLPPTYIIERGTHESRGSNPHQYVMTFEKFRDWDVNDQYSVEIRKVRHEKEEHEGETRIIEVSRTLERTFIRVDRSSNFIYMIAALTGGYTEDATLGSYANSLWWEEEIAKDKPGLYAKYFPEEYASFRDQLERSRARMVESVMLS